MESETASFMHRFVYVNHNTLYVTGQFKWRDENKNAEHKNEKMTKRKEWMNEWMFGIQHLMFLIMIYSFNEWISDLLSHLLRANRYKKKTLRCGDESKFFEKNKTRWERI